MSDVIAAMRERLAPLCAVRLEIRDDSARHAGHAGARAGGGHFVMTIVSAQFAGKGVMERHRMVYDALGALMKNDIHALSIAAKTPEET
ncbi:MAG: BolA family transcriptional regulator [Rhodocyclaceae bacterium]|nr:BolA family transcriptional regulator [Rhodocyclaceae bacterium]